MGWLLAAIAWIVTNINEILAGLLVGMIGWAITRMRERVEFAGLVKRVRVARDAMVESVQPVTVRLIAIQDYYASESTEKHPDEDDRLEALAAALLKRNEELMKEIADVIRDMPLADKVRYKGFNTILNSPQLEAVRNINTLFEYGIFNRYVITRADRKRSEKYDGWATEGLKRTQFFLDFCHDHLLPALFAM